MAGMVGLGAPAFASAATSLSGPIVQELMARYIIPSQATSVMNTTASPSSPSTEFMDTTRTNEIKNDLK